MSILTLDALQLAGKRVFIRVDFNVPLNAAGEITDDRRIRAALPTIEEALEAGARVILASHLGRPKGKVRAGLSLLPAAERLSELLQRDVNFVDDCVGDGARKAVQDLASGQVLLLENLRFYAGEEANDRAFSRQLAELADVWVMDAFGAAHRAHASTAGMAPFVAERAAGRLVGQELRFLGEALRAPARPFLAILGGAKVSDKIKVIDRLLARCDALLIGGAMAYTFLKSQGVSVGASRVEEGALDVAKRVLERAELRGVAVHLPIDHVVSARFDEGEGRKITSAQAIPEGLMGLDIGPQTTKMFAREVAKAGTVFWNGPMGVFEVDAYAKGTLSLAESVAAAEAVSVIGGGDSAAAIQQAGVAEAITHISTGGGASLEFLQGEPLPGLEALAA